MKYYPQNSAAWYSFLGIVGGFFGSYLLFAPANVTNIIASYLVYPVVMIQYCYVEPLKELCAHKRTLIELEHKMRDLEHQKQDLQAQLTALQVSGGYAQETKELVEFKNRYACASSILAQVIMQHISDPMHFFLIDAGSNKGVTKDMVAVWKNHLVGRVVEVYPLYSKIMLITDKSCKIAAYCLTTHATGIHTGMNSTTNGALQHVSHLQPVQLADTVVSSGEGLVFPRGFALGTITGCTVNGMLWEISTKPLIDIHTVDYCYVLQKGNEFALREGQTIH